MRGACLTGVALLALGVLLSPACSSGGGDGDFTPGGAKDGGGGKTGSGGGSGVGGSGSGPLFEAGSNDVEITGDSACGETTLQAEAVPLELYFMLDRSESMKEIYDGQQSLKALRDGISSFLNDAASAGIYATAQRLPILADENDPLTESCDSAQYAAPPMPWSVIPYPQLAAWVQLLKAVGLTPSVPALQGSIDACKARLAEVPGHRCAVIFVTDGLPQGTCTTQDPETDLGNLAADAYDNSGIAVFTIGFPGMPDKGQQVLKTIASKGGTTEPILIEGGNVGQAFIDALNKIRGQALACEYKMPALPPGKKPTFVVVRYTPGAGGAAQQLKRKATKADCGQDQGWYYDNNDNPTKILLCPASCAVVQPDTKGKVEVLVMCTEQPL